MKSRMWLWFFISLALQGLSLSQYLPNLELYNFNWFEQFLWLALISAICTFAAYFYLTTPVIIGVLFIRYVLTLVVYLPGGLTQDPRLMFLIALLLDISILFAFPVNLITSLTAFFSIVLITFLSLHYTLGFTLFHIVEMIINGVPAILIILPVSFFRKFHDAYREHKQHMHNLNTTINKLTDANTGFQHYVKVAEKQSAEHERNRIIRELHDSLGYVMTSIIMLSESGIKLIEQKKNKTIDEIMKNINYSAKTGLTDIRIALRVMKPKMEHQSYSDELKKLVNTFEQATNMKITLNYNQISEMMDPDHFHIIFRLIQEGMINALRHGGASEVRISLFQEEKHRIILSIADNGKGVKNFSVGLGIQGIQERLNAIGGEISLYNTNKGVILRGVVPLTPMKGSNEGKT